MRNWLIPLALAVLSAGCATPEQREAYAATLAEGRGIAETQCAGCHAVRTYGQSPAPGAPPFRYVLNKYSGASLTVDLIEGIRVAHAMPAFQFDPKGADALVAYLRSIQDTAEEDALERRKMP